MKRLISIFSLAFFVLFPLCLFAQENEVTLEGVVVTATRDAEEIRKVPANVTVITREEIERSNAETTVDVLRDEVGVVVRDFAGNGKNVPRWTSEVLAKQVLSIPLSWWMEDGLMKLISVEWTGPRFLSNRSSGLRFSGDRVAFFTVTMRLEESSTSLLENQKNPFPSGLRSQGEVTSTIKKVALSLGKWGPLSAIVYGDYSSSEGYRENGFLTILGFGRENLL